MSKYEDALQNYTEVKDRIAEFYAKHPEGSLQFEFQGQMNIQGQDIIWGIAYAYRTPDDLRPCTGTAWEFVPGKTPFTRGSEMMNLETSAFGRCLGAMNIGLNGKGFASAQEINMAKQRDPWAAPPNSLNKPVEPDLSALGAQVIGEHQEAPKEAETPRKMSFKGGLATIKQINYLNALFKKAWESAGYKDEPTKELFLEWFNYHTKQNFEATNKIDVQTASDAIGDQSLFQESVMSWQKDSRLWQSEAF